jgi:Flp pilus assembly protein TadB
MLLLGVLVILWAVLIGSWLKDRASTRPGDSVSAFRDQLHTLQRTQPGGRRSPLRANRSESFAPVAAFGPGRPAPRTSTLSASVRRRRRDVLFALAGAAAFTFLLALVLGGPLLIVVNVLCDLALAGYVFALLQQQRIAHEKQLKVRYLPHQQAPAAARAVQRPVSGTRTSRAAGSRPARVPVRKVDTAMVPHSAAN